MSSKICNVCSVLECPDCLGCHNSECIAYSPHDGSNTKAVGKARDELLKMLDDAYREGAKNVLDVLAEVDSTRGSYQVILTLRHWKERGIDEILDGLK